MSDLPTGRQVFDAATGRDVPDWWAAEERELDAMFPPTANTIGGNMGRWCNLDWLAAREGITAEKLRNRIHAEACALQARRWAEMLTELSEVENECGNENAD